MGSRNIFDRSKGVGLLGDDMEFEMTSYLNSNFGINLNRVKHSFWLQTMRFLNLYNLLLCIVERSMMV
jgi:hypothetical protein